MDQVDPRERAGRCPGQQFGGVAGKQADIADVVGFDLGQDLRHAVDVRFAADEAEIWKGERLRHQMFAAAESDLEPCFKSRAVERAVEQFGEVARTGTVDVERKPRQQVFDQVGLVQPQLVALAAAEERTLRVDDVAGCSAGPGVLLGGIAVCAIHRSVWYNRCNSRVLGSIEEMYSCS